MQSRRSLQLFLLVLSLAGIWQSAAGQVVIATIPVGTLPSGAALNSVTNKTYVENLFCIDFPCPSPGTVTVIDGATNNTTTVNVGAYPDGVAVNPLTNKIYVSSECGNDLTCNSPGTVTVIDGATNNTTTVTVGDLPYAVAVNPVTNKIYVSNKVCGGDEPHCGSAGTVTVIDGATNNTTTVNAGVRPRDVALNSVTNKIYVSNECGNDLTCGSAGTVTVIDGATNNTTTVTVGTDPFYIGVDSVTNKIYVANSSCDNLPCSGSSPGTVTVIDGATNNTTTVNVGVVPGFVAVNPVTNKIYVTNFCGNDPNCASPGTVTVIDGATNNTLTLNVGVFPGFVAVDSVTNKIYVGNVCGNDLTCKSAATVSVINGVTNSVVPVAVGDGGYAVLAVNETTDRIYVPNPADNTVSVIAGDTALQFVSVTPCRVVDTRNPNGSFGGPPIQGGTFRSFPIPQSTCNIPATAAAYSLNVTLVPIQNGPVGYLTIWPAGEVNQPVVSTMNSLDGRIKANAAVVPAGLSGGVSVYVTDTANVVLDIDGYFAPTSGSTLAFYPLDPCRVVDTRDPNKPSGLGLPHLTGRTARDFPVLQSPCIPTNANAQAYSFNLTAVPYPSLGHALGYLEVWPTGQQPQNPVSTLNNLTATYVANAAIVPAGTGGNITAYPSDDTDLVIDVNGYFAPAGPGGLSLYPAVPCRVIDTRNGNGAFSGELTVDVVDSVCAPPSTAQAYVFSATVVPVGSLGYLTLWPDGGTQPVVSTLNAADGAITSNMAIVPTNNGKIDAYASGLTQLILDISSYFAP